MRKIEHDEVGRTLCVLPALAAVAGAIWLAIAPPADHPANRQTEIRNPQWAYASLPSSVIPPGMEGVMLGAIGRFGSGGSGLGTRTLTVGAGGRFASVRAAVAASVAGDTILVLPGTHTDSVGTSVTLVANTTLAGVDAARCKLSHSGLTSVNPVIVLRDGCRVTNLDIYCDTSASSYTGNILGQNATNCSWQVDHCRLGGGRDIFNIISAQASGTKRFEDNYVYEIGWDGFHWNSSVAFRQASRWIITRNTFVGSAPATAAASKSLFYMQTGNGMAEDVYFTDNVVDWSNSQNNIAMALVYWSTQGHLVSEDPDVYEQPLFTSRNNRVKLVNSGTTGHCYWYREDSTNGRPIVTSFNDYITLSGTGTVLKAIGKDSAGSVLGSLTIHGSNIESSDVDVFGDADRSTLTYTDWR